MKLTKLQRYTAYVIMLAEAKSPEYAIERKENICFCYLAWDLFELDIFGYVGMEEKCDSFKGCFPELLKKRPKEFFKAYWFECGTKEGTAKRIELLKQCIEETHP